MVSDHEVKYRSQKSLLLLICGKGWWMLNIALTIWTAAAPATARVSAQEITPGQYESTTTLMSLTYLLFRIPTCEMESFSDVLLGKLSERRRNDASAPCKEFDNSVNQITIMIYETREQIKLIEHIQDVYRYID